MFLKQVYYQWKGFFWIIIISLGAQFFFMARGIENVPFFLYHMFSYAHPPKDSFNVILIKTPEGYLDAFANLSSRESEMLANNISYFNKMKKNGYQDYITATVEKRFRKKVSVSSYNYLKKGLINDSIAFANYTGWWQRYFNRIYLNSFDSVLVVSSYVRFQPTFYKSPVDSLIFTCRLR